MAGIVTLLDLWKKNLSFNQGLHPVRAFHSSGSFSASAAAFAVGSTFVSRGLFGPRIAYCDVGAALPEDYISHMRSASEKFFNHDALKYSAKQYHVEPKPLFSAFELKTFTLTSLRSFLIFYLPLLEDRANMEDDDDDDDFLQDNQEQPHVDLVVPLTKSVKQIMLETTIVTTRRILERVAVHYVSGRMAWKFVKDAPKSAARKAGRRMPITVYFLCVSRTTFRANILGAAASWIVQVGIEVYRFFTSILKSGEEDDHVDRSHQIGVVGQKVFMATIRVTSSLVFASIGKGIGATLIRPSSGTWIAKKDLANQIRYRIFFEEDFIDSFPSCCVHVQGTLVAIWLVPSS